MATFVAVIKTSEGYFIPVDTNKKQLVGWTSEYDAMRYYEVGYERNHSRGYEASMSACLNWVTLQPSIVECDEKDLPTRLVGPEPERGGYRMTSIRNVAGGIIGLRCNATTIADEWEKGKKPKLI